MRANYSIGHSRSLYDIVLSVRAGSLSDFQADCRPRYLTRKHLQLPYFSGT
jgi:hypothetical protein